MKQTKYYAKERICHHYGSINKRIQDKDLALHICTNLFSLSSSQENLIELQELDRQQAYCKILKLDVTKSVIMEIAMCEQTGFGNSE